jgi:hypothetical protein
MRSKRKGASQWADVDGGSAFILPVSLLQHENFKRLSPHGCKLLLDLGRQYNGFNNGHLCAAPSVLRQVGWKSKATVLEAVAECEHYRLLRKTRQGGRNRANRYALTWWRIHEKPGDPLDVPATMQAGHDWKQEVLARHVRKPRKRAKKP